MRILRILMHVELKSVVLPEPFHLFAGEYLPAAARGFPVDASHSLAEGSITRKSLPVNAKQLRCLCYTSFPGVGYVGADCNKVHGFIVFDLVSPGGFTLAGEEDFDYLCGVKNKFNQKSS